MEPDIERSLDRLVAATQNPTRRAILLALLDDRRPRTIDEVAAIAGVHRTVAFGHLEKLTELGLLVTSRRRGRLGKPASLYSAVEGSLGASVPHRQFERLAQLLAVGMSQLADPGRAAARLAGRTYGESLTATHANSVAGALAPLQALGGAYEVQGERILARNCVFREACAAAPELVCGLHAGIIEGLLRSAGLAIDIQPIGPDHSGGCAYQMNAAA